MLKGITESGFEFEIDEARLDDMEFVEDLALAEANTAFFPRVLNRVLGEEQKKKLYDHLREESGRVPVKKAIDSFTEIMSIAGESTKNS